MNDFSTTFVVNATPSEVTDAIVDVRSWWAGEIEGASESVGDEFTYRFGDLHASTQRVVDVVAGERVEWLVLDGGPRFTDATGEWAGTTIAFEVSPAGNGTELRFTHRGLVPERECFEACSSGWRLYVDGSLRKRLSAGAL